jgi:hypothetical protein
MVWARRGKSVTRKYRCAIGSRKGRVVSDLSQCSAPIDMKKRATLRRTKAQQGAKIMRKSLKTKRINPTSKLVRKMNK